MLQDMLKNKLAVKANKSSKKLKVTPNKRQTGTAMFEDAYTPAMAAQPTTPVSPQPMQHSLFLQGGVQRNPTLWGNHMQGYDQAMPMAPSADQLYQSLLSMRRRGRR